MRGLCGYYFWASESSPHGSLIRDMPRWRTEWLLSFDLEVSLGHILSFSVQTAACVAKKFLWEVISEVLWAELLWSLLAMCQMWNSNLSWHWTQAARTAKNTQFFAKSEPSLPKRNSDIAGNSMFECILSVCVKNSTETYCNYYKLIFKFQRHNFKA